MHFVFCGTSDTSYLIITAGVPISRCNVALGCRAVSVAAPWCYEGGEVPVVGVECDTVVSVPGVEDGFPFPMRDSTNLVEGGLRVMGFSGGMSIEGLEVNRTPWLPRFLSADHHTMTPCDWCPYRDGFDHAKPYVLFESSFLDIYLATVAQQWDHMITATWLE